MASEFGPAFKRLREKRGYSVKEAAGQIMTPTALRNFESGENSTSIDNFNSLLLSIGASWDDLWDFYNGLTVETHIRKTWDLYDELANAGEFYKITQLLEEKHQPIPENTFLEELPDFLVKYNLKAEGKWINQAPIKPQSLLEHMQKVETWGFIEYSIFVNCLEIFDYDFIKFYAYKLLDSLEEKYFSLKTDFHSYFAGTMLCTRYFYQNNHPDDAQRFINRLETILSKPKFQDFYFEKVLLMQLKTAFLLQQNNPEALTIAKRVVIILENLKIDGCSPNITHEIQHFVDGVNKNNNTGIPFNPFGDD